MTAYKLMVPTSVTATGAGSSASVSASGKVTFTTCETVSVNGCFTASHINYLIMFRMTLTVTGNDQRLLLRASGSDATGTNYFFSTYLANGTSYTSSRDTSMTYWFIGGGSNNQPSGRAMYVYGPQLAEPTGIRVVNTHPQGADNPALYDVGGHHNLSTSYDGFTLTRSSGNATGTLAVYGLGQ